MRSPVFHTLPMFTDVSGSHLHCIVKYTVVSHCDCFPLVTHDVKNFCFLLITHTFIFQSLVKLCLSHSIFYFALVQSWAKKLEVYGILSGKAFATWLSYWRFDKLKCLVLVKPGAKTFSFHVTALELHCSWRKWSYLNWAKHKLDANHSVIWCISKLQCQLDTP